MSKRNKALIILTILTLIFGGAFGYLHFKGSEIKQPNEVENTNITGLRFTNEKMDNPLLPIENSMSDKEYLVELKDKNDKQIYQLVINKELYDKTKDIDFKDIDKFTTSISPVLSQIGYQMYLKEVMSELKVDTFDTTLKPVAINQSIDNRNVKLKYSSSFYKEKTITFTLGEDGEIKIQP